MELEKIAGDALDSNVELASTLEFGSAQLQTYKTVGVWPEDRVSIVAFGESFVLCRDESSVAECVADLAAELDKEQLLALIRQSLPSHCFVLDDSTPRSVASEIEAEWHSPKCENDVLTLFVNDGEAEAVFKWTIEQACFCREHVGRGIEVMRA